MAPSSFAPFSASDRWIGITGLTQPAEAREVAALLGERAAGLLSSVAFSVYTTAGTVAGRRPRPTDWHGHHPRRYPPIQRVGSIGAALPPGAKFVVSYVHDVASNLAGEVERLLDRVRRVPDALQLNQLLDASARQLKAVCRLVPPGGVIFQLHPRLLDRCRRAPATQIDAGMLGDLLEPLVESGVQRVLYDRSCGSGRVADPRELRAVLDGLGARFPGIGLGVAGGLSAETMHLVPPLERVFVDASSRLRDPVTDAFDPARAAAYVAAAAAHLSRAGR